MYKRRDFGGIISSTGSTTNTEVYFLSNENAEVFVTVKLDCDYTFTGTIKVTDCFSLYVTRLVSSYQIK